MFSVVLAIAQSLRLLQTASATSQQVLAIGDNNGSTINDNNNNSSSSNSSYQGKLEGLLEELLAGGVRGGGVPGPGQELVACGLRFVPPVDEHMSLNDVPVTALLVSP